MEGGGLVEPWTALITGIFGIIGMIVTYVLENRKREKAASENPHSERHIKLKHHPIFSRLDALKTYINIGFEIENKGKQLVFKDLLVNKIEIWGDLFMEIADEIDNCVTRCETTPAQCNLLCNTNIIHFNKGLEKYTNYFMNANYTEDERKVLKIVMEKFNRWHRHRVEYIEKAITSVGNSKFYDGCRTKQAVIFDIYIGAFADMVNDAEKTLDEINGDLKGLTYKGVKL